MFGNKVAGGWEIVSMPELNSIHICPFKDSKEHLYSMFCYCKPIKEDFPNVNIYMHNAFDNRELWEELKKRGVEGL